MKKKIVDIILWLCLLVVIIAAVFWKSFLPVKEEAEEVFAPAKWACHFNECYPIIGINSITNANGTGHWNYIISKNGKEEETSPYSYYYSFFQENQYKETKEYFNRATTTLKHL